MQIMSAGMLLEDRLRGQDGAVLYCKQMKLHANLTHVTVPFSGATSDVCQSGLDMRKGRCKNILASVLSSSAYM